MVAGADEAGRGCLAGPLVAAAVLIDCEALSRSDRRASQACTTQERSEWRESCIGGPRCQQGRVAFAASRDRDAACTDNIEALSWPLGGCPGEEAICLVDGLSLRECAVPQRAG